ncbi:hypothetical protein PVAP13_7KG243900 [Panicum virgatum]|uniref:Uncharacterized protein n=1 Tax=Panicum virgatum TaxID=38727 RepID=A0A8T0QDV8_PANVG|nr:hypothetical protein PVAP13_7KG243900 [Panicum virgatum]
MPVLLLPGGPPRAGFPPPWWQASSPHRPSPRWPSSPTPSHSSMAELPVPVLDGAGAPLWGRQHGGVEVNRPAAEELATRRTARRGWRRRCTSRRATMAHSSGRRGGAGRGATRRRKGASSVRRRTGTTSAL